jgi:hypothetical protein
LATAMGKGIHSQWAAPTHTRVHDVHALAERGRALRADRLAILCIVFE